MSEALQNWGGESGTSKCLKSFYLWMAWQKVPGEHLQIGAILILVTSVWIKGH